MSECIFCKIINRESEASIVYEDELILIIMDIDPINDGHMLIIPKAHKVDLDDLSLEELIRIMTLSKMLVSLLKETYNLDGYSIIQDGGDFNEIGHYHMHVFPRYKDDGFGWEFRDIEAREIKDVGKELKISLAKYMSLNE